MREIRVEEFKDFIKRSESARAMRSLDLLDSVILLKSILKKTRRGIARRELVTKALIRDLVESLSVVYKKVEIK